MRAASVTPEAKPVGPQAYLETVALGPVNTGKKSAIPNISVTLSDGKLEPALAPAGSSVHVSVKVNRPGDPPMNIRVFAREDSTKRVVELQANALGEWSADLPLDPKMKTSRCGERRPRLVGVLFQVASLELTGESPNGFAAPAERVAARRDLGGRRPSGRPGLRRAGRRPIAHLLLPDSGLPVRDPFELARALWWPHRVDPALLDACAAAIAGTHDFTAFTPTDTEHVRFEREILRAEWLRHRALRAALG